MCDYDSLKASYCFAVAFLKFAVCTFGIIKSNKYEFVMVMY